jgi:hypothetical protein
MNRLDDSLRVAGRLVLALLEIGLALAALAILWIWLLS